LAKDEDGKNAPCYCEYKMGFKKPVNEAEIKTEYEEQANIVSKELAKQLKIPVEYVKVITEKEYISNTEDDEEMEDDYFDDEE
jgi:sensor domain CHASE-containing protein